MMSPLLLVAVMLVPRSVAAATPAHAAADTQATQTDGTLDMRVDLLNARVKALTKLTQEKAVSAMKKCDGSRDYNERKENRCNEDKVAAVQIRMDPNARPRTATTARMARPAPSAGITASVRTGMSAMTTIRAANHWDAAKRASGVITAQAANA